MEHNVGEANVSQMKRYLTNKHTRTLIQVTNENLSEISYYTATTEGRRELMYENELVLQHKKWTWKNVENKEIDVIDED